jgi:AcrR family transcriptional regulator
VTRDEAFQRAVQTYLEGRRIDLRALALELGVGRTTIHKWFSTREELLSDVLAAVAVAHFRRAREQARGRGGHALLDAIDRLNREALLAPQLQAFLAAEPQGLRILTHRERGPMHALVVEAVQMIKTEMAEAGYVPPADPETIAFALGNLGFAFVFRDVPPDDTDLAKLRRVQALVLGVED